jgi:hypothetical protein
MLKVETFEMLHPGIPEKAVKSFSVVKAVEKLLHHEPAYYDRGHVAV